MFFLYVRCTAIDPADQGVAVDCDKSSKNRSKHDEELAGWTLNATGIFLIFGLFLGSDLLEIMYRRNRADYTLFKYVNRATVYSCNCNFPCIYDSFYKYIFLLYNSTHSIHPICVVLSLFQQDSNHDSS